MKDKEYKKWLPDYSNLDNNGYERYNLTWNQIRTIIKEEIEFYKLHKEKIK